MGTGGSFPLGCNLHLKGTSAAYCKFSLDGGEKAGKGASEMGFMSALIPKWAVI